MFFIISGKKTLKFYPIYFFNYIRGFWNRILCELWYIQEPSMERGWKNDSDQILKIAKNM